jgi:predicted nucleotidyltransferase
VLEEFLERRRTEREKVLAYLNELACRLRAKWGRISLVLFGSYARGDFNYWSDVDVIIVSDHFVGLEFPRRGAEMIEPVDAICWTPDEAIKMIKKDSWRQALSKSIMIADDYGLLTKPEIDG